MCSIRLASMIRTGVLGCQGVKVGQFFGWSVCQCSVISFPVPFPKADRMNGIDDVFS